MGMKNKLHTMISWVSAGP